MIRNRLLVAAFGSALVLAACGSSGASSPPATTGGSASASTAATPSPVPTPSPTVALASPTTAASETPEPTGLAGAPDPCAIVTSAEASALAGTTYGAGSEDTTEGNGRICVYGSGTLHITTVNTGLAPDEATAKAEEAAFKTKLEQVASQAGAQIKMNVTELPNWQPGVDAALISGGGTVSGVTISASAMYLLKGTTFVGFGVLGLGATPPSNAALEAQGMTVLGRI